MTTFALIQFASARFAVVSDDTFLVLLLVLVLGFVSQDAFLNVVNNIKSWIWGDFRWLFSGYGMVAVVVCCYACFSKFGDTVIGGKDAKPILSKFNWFAISLCTTIAAGLMFWAAAEPLYLMSDPSPYFGLEPNSPQAAVFAMAQIPRQRVWFGQPDDGIGKV